MKALLSFNIKGPDNNRKNEERKREVGEGGQGRVVECLLMG